MVGIEFIGNVTKDCELRTTQSGTNVCSFTVAVNDKFNKDNPPTYFKVTAWRKLAETCGKFVTRGMKIYVHCNKIEVQTYNDNKGELRTTIAVTADDVEFLSKSDSARSEDRSEDYSGAPEVPQTQSNGYTDVSSDFQTDELPF